MTAEGVTFKTSAWVGKDFDARDLLDEYDAICLTGGSTHARDLPVPGRELSGVHYAMEYLTQQNRLNSGQTVDPSRRIEAEGKRVVILGGGDTGADCLGTAHRQGAEVVYQFEIMPEPPKDRDGNNPWPEWPLILRTSSAHEEGGIRDYNISTASFSGSDGHVERLHGLRVEPGAWPPQPIPDTDFELEADLVLLAMGFVHPEHDGMLDQLGVEYDQRGNVLVDNDMRTSVPNGLLRRRHGPRTVPRSLGNRRRPRRRRMHRPLPHGPNTPRTPSSTAPSTAPKPPTTGRHRNEVALTFSVIAAKGMSRALTREHHPVPRYGEAFD